MQNVNTASLAKTKQQIMAEALTAMPINEQYGTAECRKAIVTLSADTYKAVYNDIEIAAVKRVDDLATLLIDKKYTMKAKWANINELKFECDVPADTPYKLGMKKVGGKIGEFKANIKAVMPINIESATKAELMKAINEIITLINAE